MIQTVSFAGRQKFFLLLLITAGVMACSPSRRIASGQLTLSADTAAAISLAQQVLINDTALAGAHAGISIYDPATNRYLYNYQGDHYFVPASNTKLFTCYAAMKYLGDSLVGARYEEKGNEIYVYGTADPTFLHPDFKNQLVFDYLKANKKEKCHLLQKMPSLTNNSKLFKPYGKGWAWDDYAEDYMPERSHFPIHGNVVTFSLDTQTNALTVSPAYFLNEIHFFKSNEPFSVIRDIDNNTFWVNGSARINNYRRDVPFRTTNYNRYTNDRTPRKTPDSLLSSIIGYQVISGSGGWGNINYAKVIHSQPTDSLLKPMMHRSDNFFAEQSLLMVSNEKLGYMSDEAIIDTLLKNDLKDLPQKPVWVDGSGLSRYNEFTPQDIVTVLLKIKNEFGLERIRNILPKGNTGTLTNYYEKIGPAIFAKTGSLSGQIALSGYLTCKSGKLLLFSVLVNNHNTSGRAVRRAVEKFVLQVWEKN